MEPQGTGSELGEGAASEAPSVVLEVGNLEDFWNYREQAISVPLKGGKVRGCGWSPASSVYSAGRKPNT